MEGDERGRRAEQRPELGLELGLAELRAPQGVVDPEGAHGEHARRVLAELHDAPRGRRGGGEVQPGHLA